MEVGDGSLRKNTGEESSDVGRVRGEEDDAEASPDVDEELIRPRFRCFECHQVTEEEAVHNP